MTNLKKTQNIPKPRKKWEREKKNESPLIKSGNLIVKRIVKKKILFFI